MEQILNQILGELKDLKEGQSRLDAKIESVNINLSDKINSLEKKMNTRFDKVEKDIKTVYDQVGDLVEFKLTTQKKLGRVK